MATSRSASVRQLWNRFVAAVLLVLGAALNSAAVSETPETRVSRAEAAQLDAIHAGKPAAALAAKLDSAGSGGVDDQPVLASSVLILTVRQTGRTSAVSGQPAQYPRRIARDGESRAPPSA
jgi:hypothetical protein